MKFNQITVKHIVFYIIPLFSFIFYSIVWDDIDMKNKDLSSYISAAVDISDGSIDYLNTRTPGFPILLLITNSINAPTKILFTIQLLMYIVSILLLAWILKDLEVNKWFLLMFSFIALLPINVSIVLSASTETLTIFTLTLGFLFLYLSFTGKYILFYRILFGLFWGYAAITRPTYQALFLLMIAILVLIYPVFKVLKRSFLKSVIVLMISSLFIMAPIFYNNYSKFGYFGLTPLFGFNLSIKTVHLLERIPNDYGEVKKILIKYRDNDYLNGNSIYRENNYIWDAIPELLKVTGKDYAELSKYMQKLNILLIKQSPFVYLAEVGSAISAYWNPHLRDNGYFGKAFLKIIFTLIHFFIISLFILLVAFLLVYFFLLAFYSNRFYFERKMELYLLMLMITTSIIFYTMIVSTFFEIGNPRYRVPTDPFILFSIPLMITIINKFIKKRIY